MHTRAGPPEPAEVVAWRERLGGVVPVRKPGMAGFSESGPWWAVASPAVLASGVHARAAVAACGYSPLRGVPGPALRSDTYGVDQYERRRSARDRIVTRTEALGQAVTERAVEVVVSAVDVNALLDRVDLNAVLDRVDINRLLDRVDMDHLLGRVDVESLAARLDLNQLLAEVDLNQLVSTVDITAIVQRVDVNQIVQQVDVNEVIRRVDVEAVVDRVDVNGIVDRIDFDALVEQTDLGAVIAASSSGIASDALDAVRSQTVGLDEFIARWIGRLRRRPYTGPPGPPDGLRAEAGS